MSQDLKKTIEDLEREKEELLLQKRIADLRREISDLKYNPYQVTYIYQQIPGFWEPMKFEPIKFTCNRDTIF